MEKIKEEDAGDDPTVNPRKRYYAEILVELKDGKNSDDAWEQLDDILWEIADRRITLLVRPATINEENEW